MCNNYNLLTNAEAMIRLGFLWQQARNVPPLSIYPDYFAPIIRDLEGSRLISLARWGLPSLKDPPTDKVNKGTTNVRHPWFDDWKGYLGVEHRCLVPFDSFAEPTKLEDGSSGNAWFALDQSMPLAFFAGLRASWHGTRRKDEGPRDHEVFAFFTTEPNDVVRPIHKKAMPVVLRTAEERELWLQAPWSEARALQKPLPDGELEVIATLPLKQAPGIGETGPDPLRLSDARRALL